MHSLGSFEIQQMFENKDCSRPFVELWFPWCGVKEDQTELLYTHRSYVGVPLKRGFVFGKPRWNFDAQRASTGVGRFRIPHSSLLEMR